MQTASQVAALLAYARLSPDAVTRSPDGSLSASNPLHELSVPSSRELTNAALSTNGQATPLDWAQTVMIRRELNAIVAARDARAWERFRADLLELTSAVGPHMREPGNRFGVNTKTNTAYAEQPARSGVTNNGIWASPNSEGKKLGHVVSGRLNNLRFDIGIDTAAKEPRELIMKVTRHAKDLIMEETLRGAKAQELFDTIARAFTDHPSIRFSIKTPS